MGISESVTVTWSKLAVKQPRVVSTYPQEIFSVNLYISKDGSIFTLESLTNRSHQVDLRSLCDPCSVFKSLCNMKPGYQCLMYT